jgi:hypothetical protein
MSDKPKKEYLCLDARGTIIKAPLDMLLRSSVIKSWYDDISFEDWIAGERRCTDGNNKYYINREADDIHNLLNYLNGYKYVESDQLIELINDLAIDEKSNNALADEIIKKITKNILPYGVIYSISTEYPLNIIQKCAVLLNTDEYEMYTIKKGDITEKYDIIFFNKADVIMKSAVQTGNHAYILPKIIPCKIIKKIAKLISVVLIQTSTYSISVPRHEWCIQFYKKGERLSLHSPHDIYIFHF